MQVQTDYLRRWFCPGAARGICIEFFIKCMNKMMTCDDGIVRVWCVAYVHICTCHR